MYGLLLLMFLLGVTQLLMAFVYICITKYRSVRMHLLYYFVGVIAYFTVVVPVAESIQGNVSVFFGAFFFIGAFALAGYNFWIFGTWRSIADREEAEMLKKYEVDPFMGA